MIVEPIQSFFDKNGEELRSIVAETGQFVHRNVRDRDDHLRLVDD